MIRGFWVLSMLFDGREFHRCGSFIPVHLTTEDEGSGTLNPELPGALLWLLGGSHSSDRTYLRATSAKGKGRNGMARIQTQGLTTVPRVGMLRSYMCLTEAREMNG